MNIINFNFRLLNRVTRRFIILGAFILISIFVLEIWVANSLSTFGSELNKYKITQDNLKLENSILENQIAEKSSLTLISQRALNLGFEPIKNFEYISGK